MELSDLNDKQKSLIDPKDRKTLGARAMTYKEAEQGAEVKLEKDLHDQYLAYLRRNGFSMDQVIHAPMNKKSHLPEGWPDFTVFRDGKVMMIEFKVNYNKLSEKQEALLDRLISQGFSAYVLRNYSSAMLVTTQFFGL